jgi:hydroxymethylbilane synthase
VRLATRGSALALAQASLVADALGGAEVVVATSHDGEIGDKSRFVSGVEQALLDGEADIGVHSAKDLPADLAPGLVLAGVPAREAVEDVFVGSAGALDELPEGARVGTASLRRRSQLLALRPDLDVADLHGNVDTRIGRVAAGDFQGAILAAAGLGRLGRADEIAFVFSRTDLVPAPGQGALALEVRVADEETKAAAASLNDAAALAELTAERTAVIAMGATCFTPVGVNARLEGDRLQVSGYAGLPDGSDWIRDMVAGDAGDAADLGAELAERMLGAGAGDILRAAAE